VTGSAIHHELGGGAPLLGGVITPWSGCPGGMLGPGFPPPSPGGGATVPPAAGGAGGVGATPGGQVPSPGGTDVRQTGDG